MRPIVDEPISPELVMVDPELARRVREFAVAGPARSPGAGPATPTWGPEPAALERHASRRRPRVLDAGGRRLVLRWVGGLLLLAGLGAALLPPRDAPHLVAAPRLAPVPPRAAALRRPRPVLIWQRAAGADYYLVELWRDGRLVHAETVKRLRLRVPAWLRAGRHDWRVYAGSGTPSAGAARGPIERGWIIVER